MQLRQEKAAGWVCYLHTTKDVPDGIVSINHKVGTSNICSSLKKPAAGALA